MNFMENTSAAAILDKIKNSKNILINMDTRTDYDALCSSIVLNKFIQSLNIKSKVIHANKINQTFNRFDFQADITTETDISTLDLNLYDLIIFLDSGTKVHVSLNDKFLIPAHICSINIDHHVTNDMFGDLNYIHHIGSCCSVLYKFFKELSLAIPKEYLDIMAVGLLTDTGFFKFDSAKPEDFRIAADMLEQGVKIWEIISKLTSYEYIDQIRFKELVYRNLKTNFNKKYAYSTITLKEIRDSNINMDKVFIRHSDLIKYIEGIDMAFVIAEVESDPKYYELSFRSKTPDVDVSKIAEIFGGGGHTTGAGASLYGVSSIEEALDIVLKKLAL